MSSEPPQAGDPGTGSGGPSPADEPGGQQPYGGYPPTGVSPDPLVPFSFNDWVSKVVGTVQRSWKPLAIIQVAVFVPVAILAAVLGLVGLLGIGDGSNQAVAPGSGGVVLVIVVAVVLGGIGQAASVFVVVRDAAARPYTSHQVFAFAKNRALPMIGWSLLAGILTLLGLLLVVFPGIYLGTVFAGALAGVVVIERAGMDRAFTLVNPRFFPVLGRMALLVLVVIVYSIVLGVIAGLVSLANPVLGQLVSNILTVPIAIIGSAATVVIYAENRFHEYNPVHTPVLADEIDRP